MKQNPQVQLKVQNQVPQEIQKLSNIQIQTEIQKVLQHKQIPQTRTEFNYHSAPQYNLEQTQTNSTFQINKNPPQFIPQKPVINTTTQYSQTKHVQESNHVENFQYSRPITNNKIPETNPRVVPTEIKEQSNYQYVSQIKPEINYEISPNYQVNNTNPNMGKTKDFKLKSVIRSITTTKRPSQLRSTLQREYDQESYQNHFEPQFEESGTFTNINPNSHLFVEGHTSYIKLQSNKFQDSQLIAKDNTEFDYSSNINTNFQSNLMNYDTYAFQKNPLDSLNQTQDIPNQNVNSIQNEKAFNSVQEQKIELNTLINNNHFEQRDIQENYDHVNRNDLNSNNFKSVDPIIKKKVQTYITNPILNESSLGENIINQRSSIPINRHVLLDSLKSKPIKRSFTNGLRIFRKVKDSQGNIVKENLEQSINIYSNKILRTMHEKKQITQDQEKGNVKNYKTHLYTSSTLNPSAPNKGLLSDRIITAPGEIKQNVLYSSSRNIDDLRNNFINPKAINDNQLSTSIFYSGTKTEETSARNSNLKTHYVRSNRVSPVNNSSIRTQKIYSKIFKLLVIKRSI